jgi:hypothetical protein
LNNAEQKAFELLLQLDTIRGPHSTGVLAVKRYVNEHHVIKALGTTWELVDARDWGKVGTGANSLLMGHNRWATKGRITKANAHPFEFDNVIGAHNGTLRSQFNLDDHAQFEVDSENLYHHMNKNGVDHTIERVNGAFALTWYDTKAETINLLRNHERPLCYAYTTDRKSLFWASEAWMLRVALSRSEVKHTEVVDLPEMHLLSVGIPAVNAAIEHVSMRKMVGYVAPPYVAPVTTYTTYSKPALVSTKKFPVKPAADHIKLLRLPQVFYVDSGARTPAGLDYLQCFLVNDDKIALRVFLGGHTQEYKKMMASPNGFRGEAKSYSAIDGGYLVVDQRTIVEVEDFSEDAPQASYPLFDGRLVPLDEWKKATQGSSCAWCADVAGSEDAHNIIWLDRSSHVCLSCQDSPVVQEHLQGK